MKKETSVLCVPRNKLPIMWQRDFGWISVTAEDLAHVLCGTQIWIERQVAESDPDYKQIIPYLLVQNQSGDYAFYRRHGSEKRIHGFYSVGVGGHIDYTDDPGDGQSLMEIVIAGAKREINEEFKNPYCGSFRFLGLINEELTEVGRVHLGLVFHVALGNSPAPAAELDDFQWIRPDWIQHKMEYWSELAIELLKNSS